MNASKKIKNLFGNYEMSWKRLIIFSFICGVVPGLLMIPDFLRGTSLQMPGISYEFWVLAAMFIILNCHKALEAGIKTFVFFLISQPIIYLVQVPFSWRGWDLFSYYPFWLCLTFASFFGAMVAWLTKKEGWLSVLILSVANGLLAVILTSAVSMMLDSFPKMSLACIFILSEMVWLIMIIIKDKKKRIVAFLLALLMIAVSSVMQIKVDQHNDIRLTVEVEGEAPYEIVSDIEGLDVTFRDGFADLSYTQNTIADGVYSVIYMDKDGVEHEIRLISENGEIMTE